MVIMSSDETFFIHEILFSSNRQGFFPQLASTPNFISWCRLILKEKGVGLGFTKYPFSFLNFSNYKMRIPTLWCCCRGEQFETTWDIKSAI